MPSDILKNKDDSSNDSWRENGLKRFNAWKWKQDEAARKEKEEEEAAQKKADAEAAAAKKEKKADASAKEEKK